MAVQGAQRDCGTRALRQRVASGPRRARPCTHLQQDLDTLHRSGHERCRDRREETGRCEFAVREDRRRPVRRHRVDELLAHSVTLQVVIDASALSVRAEELELPSRRRRIWRFWNRKQRIPRRSKRTQKETANMGVTAERRSGVSLQPVDLARAGSRGLKLTSCERRTHSAVEAAISVPPSSVLHSLLVAYSEAHPLTPSRASVCLTTSSAPVY